MTKWAVLFSLFLFISINLIAADTPPSTPPNNQQQKGSGSGRQNVYNVSGKDVLPTMREEDRLEREKARLQKMQDVRASVVEQCKEIDTTGAFKNADKYSCSGKFQKCLDAAECKAPKVEEEVVTEKKDSSSDDEEDSDDAFDAAETKKSIKADKDSKLKSLNSSKYGACKDKTASAIASGASDELESLKTDLTADKTKVDEAKKALRTLDTESLKDSADLLEKINSANARAQTKAAEYQKKITDQSVAAQTKMNELLAAQDEIALTIKQITDVDARAADSDFQDATNAVEQECHNQADQKILEENRIRDQKAATGKNKLNTLSDVVTSAMNGGVDGETVLRYNKLTAACKARKLTQDKLASILRKKATTMQSLNLKLQSATIKARDIALKLAMLRKTAPQEQQQLLAEKSAALSTAQTEVAALTNRKKNSDALAQKNAKELDKELKDAEARLDVDQARKDAATELFNKAGGKAVASSADAKTKEFTEFKRNLSDAVSFENETGLSEASTNPDLKRQEDYFRGHSGTTECGSLDKPSSDSGGSSSSGAGDRSSTGSGHRNAHWKN